MGKSIKNNNEKLAKKKLGFFRILSRIALTIIALMLLLSIAIIIAVQTDSFRSWLAGQISSIVNDNIEGELSFTGLEVGLFPGHIMLDNVLVTVEKDTLFFSKEITVDFFIEPLFKEYLIANNIELKNPIIRVHRSVADGLWNVEKLAKPSIDTSVSEPPNWRIKVNTLKLVNANILFCDSLSMEKHPLGIDYMNMSMKSFNLDTKAEIKLKTMEMKFKIRKMNFVERNSGWKVDDISLLANLNNKGISVSNFNYKSPDSEFNIDCSLSNINVFENADISKAVINAELHSDRLSSKEIMRFGKPPIKIQGKYKIDIKAAGILGEKLTAEMKLETGSTRIQIDNCSLINIFDPQKMIYEAYFGETNISKKDIQYILPDINISQSPNFADVSLENTFIKGSIDTVFADFNLKSSFGNAKGQASVGFANPLELNYSADFSIENLNLSRIFNNSEMSSSINTKIKASGNGTDIKTLKVKLAVDSWNSSFSNYRYNNLVFKADIDNSILKVDSLYVMFSGNYEKDSLFLAESPKSYVFAKAMLNLVNLSNPKYDIDLKYKSINLSKLLNNPSMPEELSGKMSFNGSGIHLDSIEGNISNFVEQATFHDRSLFPFSTSIKLERLPADYRRLSLNSDYLDINLEGKYNYNTFLSLIKNQGTYLSYYFLKKINSINPTVSRAYIDSLESQFERIIYFDPMKFTLQAEVKDIAILNTFLDDIEIYSEMNLKMDWNVDSTTSNIAIDSLNITSFQMKSSGLSLLTTPMLAAASIKMSIIDSLPKLDNMKLSAKCEDKVFLNENTIAKPFIELDFDGNAADFRFGALYNDKLDILSKGSFLLGDTIQDLAIDELNIKYNNKLQWNLASPVAIQLVNKKIDINSFVLKRENAEKLIISGSLTDNLAKDLVVRLDNFPLSTLKDLSPEKNETLEQLSGLVSDVKISINGSFDEPNIELLSHLKDIKLEKDSIGDVDLQINYADKMANGHIRLATNILQNKKAMVDMNIISLPLNIPPDSTGNVFIKNRRLNIQAKAEKFPLEIAQLFLTQGIKELSGNADLFLEIGGYAPDEIEFNGFINLNDSHFLVEATNIDYSATGSIKLNDKEISLENITVSNIGKHKTRGGSAVVTGKISLRDFKPDNFNLNVSTNSFLVLSDASKKTMPDLYGDIVIATGPNPLKISGTLSEPNISGDIKVLLANLTLPQQTQQHILFSTVHYEYSGKAVRTDTLLNLSEYDWDSTMKTKAEAEKKALAGTELSYDFSKLVSYDLNIRLLQTVNALIELGPFQQVWAKIEQKDDSKPLHFVMERGSDQPKLYGNLIVKEGSKLDFYKSLSTEGEILMASGNLTNPGLDLKAVYNGKSYINEDQRYYTVTIYVKGTKEKPDILFDYSINGEPAIGDTSSIRENAMLLLLFGRTKNEFSAKSQTQGDIVTETVTSSASSLISSQLTSALQKTGVITGADIEFSEGQIDFSNAKVTLTGQIVGNVMWRFGGTVADFANNNEISIDIPIGSIHPVWMNNIILQLTRSISPATTTIRNANEWEVKLKFGGSW